MGLYFVYTPSTHHRKTDHLFTFYRGRCFHNDKYAFDAVKGLDSYKQINDYSLKEKIDSYEIVIGDKYPLNDILAYFVEYLTDKDINIGLITIHRNYLENNKSILSEYGVTYFKSRPISKGMSFDRIGFSMLGLENGHPKLALKTKQKIVCEMAPAIKLDESFHDKFMKLLIESGKDNVEVYKASGISRQVFSKIISDKDMIPTKLTLMSLCIGLELPLFAARELMESAGYSLSGSLLMDSIIIKYLRDEIYDFSLINSELNEYGCQLLGWHPRDN